MLDEIVGHEFAESRSPAFIRSDARRVVPEMSITGLSVGGPASGCGGGRIPLPDSAERERSPD